MVLFLEELTPAEAPGIDTENPFYVIIGMEANGAFDVQDGAVIARSDQVRGLAERRWSSRARSPRHSVTFEPSSATVDQPGSRADRQLGRVAEHPVPDLRHVLEMLDDVRRRARRASARTTP